MSANSITVVLSDELNARINQISSEGGLSRATLAEQALADYMAREEERVQSLNEAIVEADDGVFVSHDEVVGWLHSWGTADETSVPL